MKFSIIKFEMRQLCFTVFLILFLGESSTVAEVASEIEILKGRVTSLENEVSILKTEKDELLTVKTDVNFLLEKNSEIMEKLTKMSQNDITPDVIRKNENPSYLQTISGWHFQFDRILYTGFH